MYVLCSECVLITVRARACICTSLSTCLCFREGYAPPPPPTAGRAAGARGRRQRLLPRGLFTRSASIIDVRGLDKGRAVPRVGRGREGGGEGRSSASRSLLLPRGHGPSTLERRPRANASRGCDWLARPARRVLIGRRGSGQLRVPASEMVVRPYRAAVWSCLFFSRVFASVLRAFFREAEGAWLHFEPPNGPDGCQSERVNAEEPEFGFQVERNITESIVEVRGPGRLRTVRHLRVLRRLSRFLPAVRVTLCDAVPEVGFDLRERPCCERVLLRRVVVARFLRPEDSGRRRVGPARPRILVLCFRLKKNSMECSGGKK